MIRKILGLGWFAVEAGLVLVLLCVLLNIILGRDSGAFIAGVAGNANSFLQAVPPGSFLGVVLIVLLVWFYKNRTPY